MCVELFSYDRRTKFPPIICVGNKLLWKWCCLEVLPMLFEWEFYWSNKTVKSQWIWTIVVSVIRILFHVWGLKLDKIVTPMIAAPAQSNDRPLKGRVGRHDTRCCKRWLFAKLRLEPLPCWWPMGWLTGSRLGFSSWGWRPPSSCVFSQCTTATRSSTSAKRGTTLTMHGGHGQHVATVATVWPPCDHRHSASFYHPDYELAHSSSTSSIFQHFENISTYTTNCRMYHVRLTISTKI